jgi:hypothetical protein
VDDGGAGLLVLGLGDPHGLEGGEGGEDGASDPDEEIPLGGGNDLDLHGGGREGSHFLAESLANAGEHCVSAGHNDVPVEVLPNISMALKDGLVYHFMEAGHFLADEHGLEEGFGTAEALRA